MRVISTYEFRNNLSDYIDEVYLGKVPLVVGRFNKPLVVIKPFEGNVGDDFMRFFGFITAFKKTPDFKSGDELKLICHPPIRRKPRTFSLRRMSWIKKNRYWEHMTSAFRKK